MRQRASFTSSHGDKMKWDSLWLDAQIACCPENDNSYGLLLDGVLAISQGKIAWIGSRQTFQAEFPVNNVDTLAEKVISLSGKLITPGLVDCHTHLVYAGNRANEFSLLQQGQSYTDIARQGGGIMSTVRATRQATPDILFKESAQRLQQIIRHGVTTIEIKSGYGLTIADELKQLHVIKKLAEHYPVTISPTLLAAHVLPPEYQGRAEAYLDDICLPLLSQVKKENLASAVDIFCDHMAFNVSHVEKLFNAAISQGLKVKLHADQLSSTHSVNVAAAYRALSADHLEYADESDIASMAEAKMTAVLLPGAYYFLHQTKIPPIQWLREYHVPIALATDCNPGSSPCVSLPLMMNMAAVFWQITPVEALRGVTIHAAKALGLETHYGSLELNKKADFVVWDVRHPDELTYQMGAFLPEKIMRQGVEIFHDNAFI